MAITTAIAAVAAVGVSGAGMYEQTQAAKKQAGFQQQQIEAEQRQEALRQQAMELDAKRKQMEVLRTQQRARSMALATANAQGASQGSVLAGAYGGIEGQSNTNSLGINQALSLGRQNFALNGDISSARIGMAGAQADYAFGGALNSLGGTILNNLGTFSKIGQGFGGFGNSSYSTRSAAPSNFSGNNPYSIY